MKNGKKRLENNLTKKFKFGKKLSALVCFYDYDISTKLYFYSIMKWNITAIYWNQFFRFFLGEKMRSRGSYERNMKLCEIRWNNLK